MKSFTEKAGILFVLSGDNPAGVDFHHFRRNRGFVDLENQITFDQHTTEIFALDAHSIIFADDELDPSILTVLFGLGG